MLKLICNNIHKLLWVFNTCDSVVHTLSERLRMVKRRISVYRYKIFMMSVFSWYCFLNHHLPESSEDHNRPGDRGISNINIGTVTRALTQGRGTTRSSPSYLCVPHRWRQEISFPAMENWFLLSPDFLRFCIGLLGLMHSIPQPERVKQ